MKKFKINEVFYIYTATVLKILVGIYLSLNFFDILPGNFEGITVLFIMAEFIERILVSAHKEIYHRNLWEAGINYDTFFPLVIINKIVFWFTFILLVYTSIFNYGWLVGITDWLLVYLIIFLWLGKGLAKVITGTAFFFDNLP